MDSRCYLFIFPIRGSHDIPADFPPAVKQLPFDAGVFLPQNESNGCMRPPQFPARLLFLAGRRLHIIPHPLSDELPIILPLDDLLQLEIGAMFLFGWLKFTTVQNTFTLQYNRRDSQPLEALLQDLKHRWISSKNRLPSPHLQAYGKELDLKFFSELRDEIRGEEQVALQYFAAPRKFEYKLFCFRREAWTAGHLLLATSAPRLVWITDQYRNHRELYASITRSALLSALSDIHLTQHKEQFFLDLKFRTIDSWRLPIEGKKAGALLQHALRQIAAGPWAESAGGSLRSMASHAAGQQEA